MFKLWHSLRMWLAKERLCPRPVEYIPPDRIAFRRRQEVVNLDDIGIGFPHKSE